MPATKHIVCPHCGGVNRVPEDRLDETPSCGACHQPLFDGKPVELTGESLRQHLARNDIPVLVDFWAPWCGPCRMMAPAFAQAAGQLAHRVRFAKLNTEEYGDVAGQFGIRGIPTLILFQDGREAARVSGAMDQRRLTAWIEQHL